MLPGPPEEWLMLKIEPGSTFLEPDIVRTAAEAHLDGDDATRARITQILWAEALRLTIRNDGAGLVWPHEVARIYAEGLERVHDTAVVENGEDAIAECYEAYAVELKRVLEQVDADVEVKVEAERNRLRVRRHV